MVDLSYITCNIQRLQLDKRSRNNLESSLTRYRWKARKGSDKEKQQIVCISDLIGAYKRNGQWFVYLNYGRKSLTQSCKSTISTHAIISWC